MRRLRLMQLGWGYAMLGFPVWLVMLHTMPRSAGPGELAPSLVVAGIVAAAVSLVVPATFQRSRGLRARLLPPSTLGPGASEAERAEESNRRDARAFEIHLVVWVVSLITAAIPGMVGLMLGVLGRGMLTSHAFILTAAVLTAIRFPTERALGAAVERT